MIDKVYLAQKWRDITECKFPPQQAWTWAGLRPIRTIGFDKPPVGRGKSDCWKQRASRKSLSWLSNMAWLSWLSLLNISGAALVTLPRHRLNQPSSRRRRIEGTTSKNNELNAYRRKESFLWPSRGSIHISRVFHTRAPGDARTNPRGFRGQRPEQRIWRKRNNFQPAYCQQASTSN